MDHLGSHLSLMKQGVKGWDIELTPLSCPDANPAEFLFSSFKAYLRKIGVNEKTHNLAAWNEM